MIHIFVSFAFVFFLKVKQTFYSKYICNVATELDHWYNAFIKLIWMKNRLPSLHGNKHENERKAPSGILLQLWFACRVYISARVTKIWPLHSDFKANKSL